MDINLNVLREAARLMREPDAADNAHMAPMVNPVLVLALADWLEAEADLHAQMVAANVGVRAATGNKWRIRLDGSTLPQAMAVAEAYLAGQR